LHVLVEVGVDEAKVVEVESCATAEVGADILEVEVVLVLATAVVVVAALVVVTALVVATCFTVVSFDGDDEPPSGQKVINRLALSAWQAT